MSILTVDITLNFLSSKFIFCNDGVSSLLTYQVRRSLGVIAIIKLAIPFLQRAPYDLLWGKWRDTHVNHPQAFHSIHSEIRTNACTRILRFAHFDGSISVQPCAQRLFHEFLKVIRAKVTRSVEQCNVPKYPRRMYLPGRE